MALNKDFYTILLLIRPLCFLRNAGMGVTRENYELLFRFPQILAMCLNRYEA